SLGAMITENASQLYAALWADLRRNRTEADLVDVAYVADGATYARQHLEAWLSPSGPAAAGPPPAAPPAPPGQVSVRYDPLGVTLIIGAWTFPFLLTLSPLIAAIAGGNAAVLKPSELSPASADALARLVPRYLDPEAFSVVLGPWPETAALLEQRWEHIYFTRSAPTGAVVMAAAAKHLTPVALELGGKSPAVVHSSADLAVAAHRIARERWINAGQTHAGVDHVLVFEDVRDEVLDYLKRTVVRFYGEAPQLSPDYGRIVSARHHDRLVALLDSGEIVHGGRHDRNDRYVAPTIILDPAPDAPVMQEEIFGPLL